jgi:hypothetical protein
MRYPAEQFTPEEKALLAPHFTNLDRPVFALVNLPETVKGALFARYSRSKRPPLPVSGWLPWANPGRWSWVTCGARRARPSAVKSSTG